jgi:hypothetical protein
MKARPAVAETQAKTPFTARNKLLTSDAGTSTN